MSPRPSQQQTEAFKLLKFSNVFPPFVHPCLPCPPYPVVATSMQAQRAGPKQRQRQHTKEIPPGFHRPPATHPSGHLQGEQAAVQGDAAHHLAAAGVGDQHCQQFFYECQKAEPGQVGG